MENKKSDDNGDLKAGITLGISGIIIFIGFAMMAPAMLIYSLIILTVKTIILGLFALFSKNETKYGTNKNAFN